MMKIALCISLVFLFNLINLHRILANPLTTSTDSTDSDNSTNFTSIEAENITTIIEATTTASENGTSDQITTVESTTIDTNLTTITDIEITTIASIHITTENDTSTVIDIGIDIIIQILKQVTTQTPIQLTTSGRVNLQVVISPTTIQVQYGQTYELICSVYGGDADTTIYWIQEEPERRYALTETNDKHITASEVQLKARIRIDDRSKIGKYTCMAQTADGNSDTSILTMQEDHNYYRPPSSGSQNLVIVAPDMADNDYVEIQCTGAEPDDEGKIQWYFNNRLLHDEQPLFPRGKTLHIRPITKPYLGHYRCSIPDSGYTDANSILTFSTEPSHDVHPVFSPSSPLSIDEGASQLIEPPAGYYHARWTRSNSQGLPSGIYQSGNNLQISNARSDQSGTYNCELYKVDGTSINIQYEINVQHRHTYQTPSIEGQRMIIQYTITSYEPIEIIWKKYTDQGYQPLSSAFTVEPNRLILHYATSDSVGTYQITVRNSHGEVQQELRVNVESRHHHQHVPERHQQYVPERQQQYVTERYPQQQEPIEVTVEPSEITVGSGERAIVTCHVKGTQQYRVTWSKYAHDTRLPDYAQQQGNTVMIAPTADTRSEQMYFQCKVDVSGQTEPHHAYATINIRGRQRKRRNVRK
ncbi:unnamed protein product [Adineta steineri]|uniref:Ig-like domain-containing protein n=1 Tax=Adineta steineri TaxID=433720 RepID=A0A813Q0R8_9BILA|nr:unnamed protein product [Adineta steineri]CAF4056849.1 unnamed protein product [Adineta steineri]